MSKFAGVSIYKPSDRSKSTDPWLIAYSFQGKRPVIRASSHRRVTDDLARLISETLDRVRLGLASPDEVSHLQQLPRPLIEHLDEYKAHLLASGRTNKHATQMHDYAESALAGFEQVGQIVASKVQQNISTVKHGGATKNRYVAAVRAFLKWGADDGRWPKERGHVRLHRFTPGEKRKRRVLPLQKIADLIDAAATGPFAEKVSGADRSLIYRTVLASGLRANELRELVVGDIRQHGIFIRAEIAKNRRENFLFIPPSLMKELHHQVLGKATTDRVFEIKGNTARMLKADLQRAGIPYKTREGVFDFHALRHQCGSMLASAGVPIKAVQVHMRHASIRMTMDTYGHLFDTDRARTVGAVDRTLQRLAQRDFKAVNEVYGMATPISDQEQWSDGESNPDLLNAIQQQPSPISVARGRLRSRRGSEVAPRAAQRLLSTVFSRAIKRRQRRARSPVPGAMEGGPRC